MNYKLYHTSAFVNNSTDVFIPTIPKYAMKGENTSILRVCLSDAIKHCLMSSSTCREALDNGQKLFKVYEFIIEDDCLLNPSQLYKDCLVPDAKIYNEYWCMEAIKPVNAYNIKIISYDNDMKLCVNPNRIDEYNRYIKKIDNAEETGCYDLCDTLYNEMLEKGIAFNVMYLKDLDFIKLSNNLIELNIFD